MPPLTSPSCHIVNPVPSHCKENKSFTKGSKWQDERLVEMGVGMIYGGFLLIRTSLRWLPVHTFFFPLLPANEINLPTALYTAIPTHFLWQSIKNCYWCLWGISKIYVNSTNASEENTLHILSLEFELILWGGDEMWSWF